MILRPALSADIPGMQRVRLSVRENQLSDPARITEADYLAALDRLGRSWVVVVDDAVVAFASGYHSGNFWALFVDPDHEGRGHGRALHATMIAWLEAQGLTRLWLTTAVGSRAEGFYRALDWRDCGLDAHGALRMERFCGRVQMP